MRLNVAGRILLLIASLSAVQVASAPITAAACPCSEVTESMIWSTPKPEDHKEGLKFTETAEFKKEFDSAIDSAKAALQKHIGEKNVAIVADIDETLLDNREDYIQNPVWSWKAFESWIKEAKAPVLKPTADLLAWARQNGYAVFLITGRNENLRGATIENLVRDKIAYDGLYMRPDAAPKDPAQIVKPLLRKQIEDMGFKIVLNIGDQYSDLTGGYAENCVKLPNKMYRVP
jgi:predicted secreted acid phosphatase